MRQMTVLTEVCGDLNAGCQGWANHGFCDSNPRYNLIYCKKSCNNCNGECARDLHYKCNESCNNCNGECTRDSHYNCNKSCNKCNGECAGDPHYNCNKSCNNCCDGTVSVKSRYYLLTKREQVTVFRLRTGHNRLNYHLYSKLCIDHTDQCPCGTGSQTTEHLLQSCPTYEPLRKGIWPDHTPVARKLYGSLRDLRCTATFIEETGVSI